MKNFGTHDRVTRFGKIKRVGKLGKYGASFYTRINSGNVNIGPQSSPPTSFGGPPAGPPDLTTPVVEPTEFNTGYRIPTADLVDWTGNYNFSNPGQSSSHNSVPATGLTITGYRFTDTVEVRTSNPLIFIDCFFEKPGRYTPPGSGGGDYTVRSHNTPNANNTNIYHPDAGKQLEFHYCSTYGGQIQTFTVFKLMYRCSFDWFITQTINFRATPDGAYAYLVKECWFGPHANMADGPLNGGQGMYDSDEWLANHSGFPHCDVWQMRGGRIHEIRFVQCTIAWTADQWSDGTVNPNNNLGANPDKLLQCAGGSTLGNALDIFEFDRCWIYGAGNTMWQCRNTPPKNLFGYWTHFEARWFSNIIALDANGGSWSTTFEDDPTSGNFMTYTRVTDGNNKFMRTNSVSLRLPPEATNAGTQVAHSDTNTQSDIFSCERWVLGLDSVNFTQTGLNEGGRTSFDRRSTPA